jgi:hypothetical protein
MRGFLFLLVLVVLLPVLGCARATPLPGLHIDETGAIARSTPADLRERHERLIAADLLAEFGPGWEAAVAITPDPSEDPRYEDERHWYWDAPTVRVGLRGPADAAAPAKQQIGRIVGQRLAPHLRHPERLVVQIER